MRIFLLEPYLTGSHAQWVTGYGRASRHEVVPITHEGQFWKWRLSGGFVTMADEVGRAAAAGGPPDVLLATSTLDLAGLLGLLRRELGKVPACLYLHENQITYPASGRTRIEDHHGLITWTSLLAADAVAFNSAFHRESALAALPGFLGRFPDRTHGHLIPAVAAKSSVLPVGVDLRGLRPGPERGDPPLILWNHRWDADKDPGTFLAVLLELAGEGAGFRVALAGERLGRQAERWREAEALLGDRVEVSRYLGEAGYREVLRRSDVVVSTARQEFFGVSVVEAIAAGAFPVLPDRLVYPERIPEAFREVCLYRGRRRLLERLRWALTHRREAAAVASELRAGMARFDWTEVAPRYDAWLEAAASQAQAGPGISAERGGGGAPSATES